MSQLLQVHIANQRLLKTASGENSPASPGIVGSPGALSPVALSPSSPQGMPIPRRIGQELQHGWVMSPNITMSGGTVTTNGGNWAGNMMDTGMDTGLEVPSHHLPMDSDFTMEGELSKLSMAVDEDEIFKVNRSDLLEPTLAELNAADADTLLDGLNFDDLYWPVDGSNPAPEATPSPQTPAGSSAIDPDGDVVLQNQPSSSFPPLANHKFIASGASVPAANTVLEQTLLQPSLIMNEIPVKLQPGPTLSQTPSNPPPSSSSSGGLRELLLRRELQNSLESPDAASPLGQSLPRSVLSPSPSPTTRLSTSAPTGPNAWEAWQQRRESPWQRRDPRPHLLSTGSLAEGGSTSSLSADVLSPGGGLSLSMDEGFDSDQLSDGDSSDDSDVSDTESNAGSSAGARRERFFWQYNVQAKGPKGQRLVLAPTQEDPHVLQKPQDPVFSPHCHIQGIKHSGKARKGDGNDLTPNPKKLSTIGKELDRLNKVIADMTPVADLPNSVKSKSRKEKNKLASRACRLKKKAQHEANKLKLYGLEQEHKRLMASIEQSRQLIFAKIDGTLTDTSEPIAVKVDRISKHGTRHRIGGHTTDFVNKVLDKVKQGVSDGGISEL